MELRNLVRQNTFYRNSYRAVNGFFYEKEIAQWKTIRYSQGCRNAFGVYRDRKLKAGKSLPIDYTIYLDLALVKLEINKDSQILTGTL